MNGVLCAIDQATTTGFAWGIPGCDKPEWCVVRFKNDVPGECLSKFGFWLRERVFALKPKIIVRENVYFPRPRSEKAKGPPPPPINMKTLSRLCAMAETIDALGYELRIKVFEVTPAEVSKFFLGAAKKIGRDEKKAAYIEKCAALGFGEIPTDAADAIAVWLKAESVIDPQAASRRRAAAGQELPLHGSTASLKAKRPGPAKSGAPEAKHEGEFRVADLFTGKAAEIQPAPGKSARIIG